MVMQVYFSGEMYLGVLYVCGLHNICQRAIAEKFAVHRPGGEKGACASML